MSDEGTALARREGGTSIGKRARGAFDPGQMELIRATVAQDCTLAELGMLLELAARYELDPFAKEIWAVKMKGRVTIMIARDGFLQIANRSGEFDGMEGDVVREKDTFSKAAGTPLPEHVYKGGEKERGAIVGAWATVFRTGRRPTYFYAHLSEYMPTGKSLNDYTPWKAQVSAMILKCAEAMALRKAFSVTGLVSEEEMGKAKLVNGAQDEVADMGEIEWGDDPSLALWLPQLFDAVNAERQGAWMPAKIRMHLKGKTDEEREMIAQDLVANLEAVGARVPEREDIQDAEVEDETEEPENAAETPLGPDDEGYEPADLSGEPEFGADGQQTIA